MQEFPLSHVSSILKADRWFTAWHADPLVLGTIGLVLFIYGTGIHNLWRRAGLGRVVSCPRCFSFGLGMLSVVVALSSPLDVLSNELSWVHMIQHMVLMGIAAPLVAFGSPGMVAIWAIPPSRRRWLKAFNPAECRLSACVAKGTWHPPLVWTLHASVLWIWHLPALYERALADPLVHDLEHLCFFLVACLFWRIVLDVRTRRVLNAGLGVLFLFTTSLQEMFLGVLMTLSPDPWYDAYAGRTERWGYTLMEDQQLAGAIMWMPGCLAYVLVAVFLFTRWIDGIETSVAESRNSSVLARGEWTRAIHSVES